MKKFREILKRIYSIILMAVSDNYVLLTYDHTEGTKYDFEYRANFPIGNDLLTDMNYAVFTWLSEHHERKQVKANEETVNKLINKK